MTDDREAIKAERVKFVSELASALTGYADALDGPHYDRFQITLAGDRGALFVKWEYNGKGKIEIRGSALALPTPYSINFDGKIAITVSMYRGAAAIAKDVERRLLPTYAEYRQKATEHKTREDEWKAGKDALLAELGKIAGSAPRSGSDTIYSYTEHAGSLNARVNSATSVKVELSSITAAQAKEVVALFAKWKREA